MPNTSTPSERASLPGNSRTPIAEDEARRVEARRLAWRDRYNVAGDEDAFVFEQLVVQSVRLERCQERRRTLEAFEAARAAACWDEDRRLEAEALGATLGRRPPVVAARLAATRAGCDWLLGRWARLGRALEAEGGWTDAQRSLAFDLLGTPRDDREGAPGEPGEAPGAIVDRELARLRRLKADGLDALDELERQAAIAGRPIRTSRDWDRLKREEDDARRRYDRARARLRAAEPAAEAPPPCPAPSPSKPAGAPPAPTSARLDPVRDVARNEDEFEDVDPSRMTDGDWEDYERAILRKWVLGKSPEQRQAAFANLAQPPNTRRG